MPPTSFAEISVSGGGEAGDDSPAWAEDEVSGLLPAEDEESILSECVQARVPQRWLSWHYRSQDESLIAFSNRQYYAGGLSSFPAPGSSVPDPGVDGHGVNLVRVDGTFHRSGAGKLLRTNPIEAEAVVGEIRRRFAAATGTPSIGVVTFNIQQRTLIEELLRDSGDERLIEALDGAVEEGLFVKNLENVQGDERDVILFSTAFSVNSRGVLPLNFGPLNRSGGERRLNVAVTRARRQVVVFSSFAPAQLRAEETSSVGIKHLRAYLDLAEQGPSALGPLPAARQLRTVDRHREEIAESLRERGFTVSTDVGLSEFTIDLVVGGPEVDGVEATGPTLAVLLDGPGWAARRTVGDRDGLPTEVLSSLMHWPAVDRVWMPEWLADREAVLDRLETVLNTTAKTHPVQVETAAVVAETAAIIAPTAAEPVPDVDPEPTASHLLPGESLFTPWARGVLGSRDQLDGLPAAASVAAIRAALIAGIEAEGPVHLDPLVRAVAAAFGLHRVVASRHESIVACLPRELLRHPGEPDFAWPASVDPLTWNGFRRTPAGVERPLEHISSREIGNAMVALCEAAAGMTTDQLWAGTLAVFGFSRRSAAQVGRLEEALVSVISDGRLSRRSDGMLLA